jgi:hypothetical protein
VQTACAQNSTGKPDCSIILLAVLTTERFFFLFPIFGIPNLPLPEDLPLNPGRGARQLGAICAGPWLSCSFRVALKFFGETSPRTLDPRARDMIDGIPRVPFACGA